MDKIILRDILCRANVGVSSQERAGRQEVLVDVELSVDLKQAAGTDDLAFSVDYLAVYNAARETAAGRSYQLLETLAEDVAGAVLERFQAAEVLVRARKRDLSGSDGPIHAAVEITRHRDA